MNRRSIIIISALALSLSAWSQTVKPEDRQVDMAGPTFVPGLLVSKTLLDGDTVQYIRRSEAYVVYPPLPQMTKKQQEKFYRLVYNIKKVLPLARECRQIIIETGKYIETLPNEKARKEHMKRVEADIKARYTPRVKKLTRSQGKLLIKLIDRECGSTGYGLIQAFLGPIRAGFYQAFSWLFDMNLNKHYDPDGVDRLTERVVRQVEAGQL